MCVSSIAERVAKTIRPLIPLCVGIHISRLSAFSQARIQFSSYSKKCILDVKNTQGVVRFIRVFECHNFVEISSLCTVKIKSFKCKVL